MADQNEFMAQMLALVDLAKANDSRITKKEVGEFCRDLELTDAQLKLVYDFLDEHNIEVAGHVRKKKSAGVGRGAGAGNGAGVDDGRGADVSNSGESGIAQNGPDDGWSTEDSKYLSLYRRELRGLKEVSDEERSELYRRLCAGDESAVHPVIEAHLKRVVTLAGKYKNRGVPLEDLIQEGNLTLLTTVDMLCGNDGISDVKKEIDRAVRARMIELADDQLESRGMERTIVTKTNLIHEATKVLAEEWGRLATVAELAEYTKMTEDEIQMYIDLSLEEIKVGRG